MPSLALRHVENANPRWIRDNLGPMEELKQDIKQHGIIDPILIKPDCLVIDGARRVEAAKSLGMQDVPVRLCRSWNDIMLYFRPSDAASYPMTWVELIDLWGIILKPIHDQHRFITAGQTRRNLKPGAHAAKPVYSGFLNDLGWLYKSPPATVKLLRDQFGRLKVLEEQFPVFVEGVTKSLPTGEQARDLTRSRVLKSVVQRLRDTDLTEHEALELYLTRLAETAVSDRPRVPRRQRINLKLNDPVVPILSVRNLVKILQDVSMQAETFTNFNAEADEVADIVQKISAAVAEINSLQRRLKASVVSTGDQ